MGDTGPGSWGFWGLEPVALGSPDLNVSDLTPRAGLPGPGPLHWATVLSQIGSHPHCEPVEGGRLTKMLTAAPFTDVSVLMHLPYRCV